MTRLDVIKARLYNYPNTYVAHRPTVIQDMKDLIEDHARLLESYQLMDKKWWFDKHLTANEGTACWGCDMGDSGEPQNPDGHDKRCPISIAHYALEQSKNFWEE